MTNTTENKALVRDFVENILIGGKMELLTEYFNGDKYIQHNLQVADGLSGLGKTLEEMASAGITMEYEKIHLMMAEGDLVLVVSEGRFADKHTSFYDIFRVENGKIIEHWDNIESIPPESEWKNINGKFGF